VHTIRNLLLLLPAASMLHAQYVYLAHQSTNNITAYRVSTAGNLAPIGTFPTGNTVGGPSGIAVDPLNRFVFVANPEAGNVTSYRIGPTGALTLIDFFAPSTGRPDSLAIDPAGKYLFAIGPHVLLPETGVVSAFVIEPSGRLTRNGEHTVSSYATNTLAVDASGKFLYLAGTAAVHAFLRPWGALEVASFAITPTGTITPISVALEGTPPQAEFGLGMAFDAAGRFLYVLKGDSFELDYTGTEYCGASIRTYRISSSGILGLTGVPLDVGLVNCHSRIEMTVDPTGRFLYVPSRYEDFAIKETQLSAIQIDANGGLHVLGILNTPADALAVATDPTGRFLYVPRCTYDLNLSNGTVTCSKPFVGGYAIGAGGSLTQLSQAPSTALLPVSIATTTCTAPLPGPDPSPVTTRTSVLSPLSTSVLIGSPQPELVTFSGSIQTSVDVSRYGDCPAVTWETRANLVAVSGVGPVSGNRYLATGSSKSNGVSLTPGTIAVANSFQIGPPKPGFASIPLNVESVVTLNQQGTPVDIAVPPSDSVSWWKAEGNFADALGLNDGVGHGVTFGPGRVGQAFQFQPFDFAPYIEVPSSTSLQPAALTVMAWVKSQGFPGVHNYVLSQGADRCVAASYALYTELGGLRFYIDNGSEVDSPVATDAQVWDGNWHLVAGSYDGARVRMYVDGAEIGAGTPTTGAINYALPDNNRFYIGAYRGGCNLGFTGSIDEVRVFNRALNPAEIQAVYQATPLP
jgi:6-phosphogluconolactonase (cycloisomerase 2 family)